MFKKFIVNKEFIIQDLTDGLNNVSDVLVSYIEKLIRKNKKKSIKKAKTS